jgi:hypothetical protein
MSDKTSEKLFGGVVASRESSENHSKENDPRFGKIGAPLYVKYRDPVLFKNSNPDEMKLSIREAMGWLIGVDLETIMICFDQPVDPLSNEQISVAGLVIPKDCILETHKVRIKKPFNRSRIGYSGHKKPYRMEK